MTEQVVVQVGVDPQPPLDEFDPKDAFYTGPGTLAGRYLRSFWQPVALSDEIEPGRARPIRILGEDFTLYRGEGGEAHVVDHRCQHRGTQLSVGQVEGDTIRCYYHGWRYDASGQCVEQPGEPKPFCDKIKIRSFPTRDYLGLIFAYLGEGEPPAFTRFERFEKSGRRVGASVTAAPFNYFQRMENAHDFVHLPFVHKQGYPKVEQRTLENVVPQVTTEECEWGMLTHRLDPNGFDLTAYFGMPNINYIRTGLATGREWEGEGELLIYRVPIDDTNHFQFLVYWTVASGDAHAIAQDGPGFDPVEHERREQERNDMVHAILEGHKSIDDAIAASSRDSAFNADDPELFAVEDDVAMMGQGVIWERRPEHLGRADIAVVLLRKLWGRELRAIREGKPRQEWRRSPYMAPDVAALPRHLRSTDVAEGVVN